MPHCKLHSPLLWTYVIALTDALAPPAGGECMQLLRCDNVWWCMLPTQAKSMGNSGLVDKLEADARLMGFQAQVAQRLEVGGLAADLQPFIPEQPCSLVACALGCPGLASVCAAASRQGKEWQLRAGCPLNLREPSPAAQRVAHKLS